MADAKKVSLHPDGLLKATPPIGGYVLSDTPIEINAGRRTLTLQVRNTGDRPTQVGSHFQTVSCTSIKRPTIQR